MPTKAMVPATSNKATMPFFGFGGNWDYPKACHVFCQYGLDTTIQCAAGLEAYDLKVPPSAGASDILLRDSIRADGRQHVSSRIRGLEAVESNPASWYLAGSSTQYQEYYWCPTNTVQDIASLMLTEH